MTAPALYATLWDYGQLVEAMDARRIELGMSHDEWNERAELERGYTSKACGPSQSAKFGYKSLFPAVRQLGLRLVLEVDESATKTILEGRVPRQNRQARSNNYARRTGTRAKRRFFSELGRSRAAQTNGNATPERRSERARYAATIRWADVKAAAALPAADRPSAESARQPRSAQADVAITQGRPKSPCRGA